MRKKLCPIVMLISLASCSENTFEEILFRTVDNPFYDTPSIDSLSLEHTVYLSWDEDDACDAFRLMRSYDQKELNFSCVYEGKRIAYKDIDLMNGSRYVYRLDKTRGKKYFEGMTHAYGYSSDCRRDEYEPNDREEDATFLEHDLICNLPCVQFIAGNRRFIDEDWFYIALPPRRAAEIVISQHNLPNESTGANTSLMVQTAGCESASVKQKVAHVINNTSHTTKRFYFKIYPNITELFSASSSTALIEYTVSLSKIYNYSL